MATQTSRRSGTSSRRTTTTQKMGNQDWIKMARNHGLKVGLCLINSTGGVVTSIPFNWNLLNDAGLNTRALEKYITDEYADEQTGQGQTRQTA